MRLLATAFVLASSVLFGQTYTISTLAGGALPINIPGPTASIGLVTGVAVDPSGNVFLAGESIVLRLDAATGALTLVAGNGTVGFSGDNGPATHAQLGSPSGTPLGVAVDAFGNLYIADAGNLRIRKVTNGIITTVAGNGTSGFSGDNGSALIAQLGLPTGVAIDAFGNLYIADALNNRIRKVANGVITTVAGTGQAGFSGDTSAATNAQLRNPVGIAVDSTGNLYIADADNQRIRKVSGGVITTVAGNGTAGFSGDNGLSTSAQLNNPVGISVDSFGNLYIADALNNRVRKVSNGVITTVAGNGTVGYSGDSGPATSAQLNVPTGVAADSAGNIYIADANNYRIRKVASGVITTVAGNGFYHFGGDNGPASLALFNVPFAVAVDSAGNLYIADRESNRIRKISNGVITTVAGNGTAGFSGDGGLAINAQLDYPTGVAVDSAGNLYISDRNNQRIRKVSNGVITTVAGIGTFGFSGDGGLAINAQLNYPYGIAVDSAGNLYIADLANQRVRQVSNGVITTLAGDGVVGFGGDGGSAPVGRLNSPFGLAVDSAGSVYIADRDNNRVRKVSNGVITTVAGGGTQGFSGDGGPATSALLNNPFGVAVDSSGSLYIADENNQRIRKVSNGVITTIAGNGIPGFSGDNGPATSGQLNFPLGVAVNSAGSIFVADQANARIRLLTPVSVACSYSVSPTSLQPPVSGGNLVVNIQTDPACPWTVSGLPSWITISGVTTGQGTSSITLVVAANAGGARSATLQIGGISVVVNQAAPLGCVTSLNPGGQSFPAAGGSGTISITAGQGCTWSSGSTVPWVTISGSNGGTGNGSTIYLVGANTGLARSGAINIAGLTFTVEQAGASISGFTNAGSIAHLAASGGWTTNFTFVNPSPTPTPVRINFFDDSGNPLTLSVNFPQTGVNGLLASSIDRTLNPGAVLELVATGPASQPVQTGWAQVLANGAVDGFAAFRLTTASIDNQALVPLEKRNASAYLLAFDNTAGFVAGVALANTSSQGGNVGISVRDDNGTPVFSSTIALGAMAHTSFVLPTSYAFTAGKRGTIEFDPPAGMQLSTLGIQFNQLTNGFSTIPAITR